MDGLLLAFDNAANPTEVNASRITSLSEACFQVFVE
jgi:hypothetical protein